MSKRAVLSVYDKAGVVDFARGLVELGWELVASGGTARVMKQAGLAVRDVSDVTGAPEMLGGRVKTLHPAIHGGILARDDRNDRSELDAQQIKMVDLVVCNLYPFEQTVAQPGVRLKDAVEQIDIGGVALLRAAAKNFQRVLVICDPSDYGWVLDSLKLETPDLKVRRTLAAKAFTHTRDYDTAITAYLQSVGA
ncbi:MAG: hypothetical protein GWP61_20650 [Chloroflexi bacterium]|nr:hypothetical protein [Chloroflexota bacterium]